MREIPGITILNRVKSHCQIHWFHQHAECREEIFDCFHAFMMPSFSDINTNITHYGLKSYSVNPRANDRNFKTIRDLSDYL